MSDPSIQLFCDNRHPMPRGADWCDQCGLPPSKEPHVRAQDSAGRPIAVGDTVTWRGEFYTIKSFGDPIGRCGTRAIEFEEPLHLEGEVPDEIGIDLVELSGHQTAPRMICRWCGGDCPRWGTDTCPFRPRQIPRRAGE